MSEKAPGNTSEGWQDETSSMEQSLHDFLAEHFNKKFGDRKDYGADFHISGGGPGIKFTDIAGQVVRINTLYKKGKLVKVHAILRPANMDSGNTDLYIDGQALEDLLS